jgi:hypothetical protein
LSPARSGGIEHWAATAGAAGIASKEGIDRTLSGDDWDVDTDPGLERATRDL